MGNESALYFSLWSKYKTPIVQLMKASSGGPQQYKLTPHEFVARGEKSKNGYAFTMEAFNGKAVNNISASNVAKDLLLVLNTSPLAVQLMSENSFEFKMDKHGTLNINRKEKEEGV